MLTKNQSELLTSVKNNPPENQHAFKYHHALFLNPYVENSATSTMMLFPPTGLEYVAVSAKGYVKKITLLDLRYEQQLSDAGKLSEFVNNEIDIIFVSIGWDRQLDEIFSLLEKMPEQIPIVVGGYTATEKVEEFFAACRRINIIVRGEGELTTREILSGMELKDILGVSYRDGGAIKHNKIRPLPDVNELAAPDRRMRRNNYKLAVNGIDVAGITFDAVLTARGCPFNCKFCTFSLNPLGQKRSYSERSVKSVIEEIESLNAKVIMFSDDNLFTNPSRTEEICDMIIQRKIKKRFFGQVRLDIAKHPRILQKMVKAGFKALLVGIESPHDWVLKQLDKGFDQATIRKAFAVLRKYPILWNGYFIYGNIGETEEEMLYIAKFAKEIGVDSISLNKLRIEKFSPLKELAQNTAGYHVTARGELYSDKYEMAKIKKIGKKIKFSFYTPGRYLRILLRNLFVIKIFTLWEGIWLIFSAPRLIASVLLREHKKGRLGDSLWRTFTKNK